MKFLIVDDLEENLIALEALIRNDEVEIYKARSGEQALELLLQHDFGLALIDVQMPVMDGFELAELMRGPERTRAVPIIFVTAGSRDQERLFRGYESGAVDFMYKPLEPIIVRNKIRVFFELDLQKKLLKNQLAELQQSEEFKNKIIESSKDCIKILDLDGKLISISIFGQKLLEINDLCEVLNSPWVEFWKGEEFKLATEALEAAKKGGNGHFVGFCPTRSGKPKWWDVIISPILNNEKQPEFILIVSRDVTQKKIDEEKLRQSEEHFRVLVEAIPQMVFTANDKGEINYWNHQWEEYIGIKPALNSTVFIEEVIHPDHRAQYNQLWFESLKTGAVFSVEHLLRNKEGEYRWHLSRAVPLRGRDGTLLKWFGTCTDIHEQKRWAEDLRASKERLQLALEAGQMATWEWDLINKSVKRSEFYDQLHGYLEAVPEWTFDLFLNSIHPDDRDQVKNEIEKTVHGETREYSTEYRTVWPDSSVHWLASRGRLIRNDENNSVLIRGAVLDITQLKQAQEQLQKALQVREEFLCIASHELNTPLTPLRLQIELMARAIKREGVEKIPKEKVQRMLDASNRQISRLCGLVDDLLDVSRVVNGKLSLDRTETDLTEVVNETIEQFQEQLITAKCPIEVKKTGNIVGIWDRQRVQQITVNLISNALKYGPGKPISISLSCEDNQAHLAVQDNGMGIAIEDQSRIFERFERAVVSKSGINGLGLGLYIVKEIVQAHGGQIKVQSQVGKGSTFIVDLPLALPRTV